MPITYRRHFDARDGAIYNCVLMPDGKWWSAENLRWAGAGVAYNNDPALEAIYGRLYTWADAVAGCPPGAHLPSDAEWTALESAIPAPDGKRLKANSSLWVTNTGTDDYGFAALPGGRFASGAFNAASQVCCFWTSTLGGSNDNAWVRVLTHADAGVLRGTNYYRTGYSVRFIVDVFNEPPAGYLFGAPFDGFDRGMTVEIDRGIRWIDTIGGVPVGIETGDHNGATDRWRVRAAFSVKADKKAAIESTLPPYGTATNIATQSREIVLPHRGGPSFPGLGPAVSDVTGDTYGGCTVRGFSSNGQRGVVVDLYDYELELEIPAVSDGDYDNDPTPLNGTAPAILATKFKAHQINDFSFTSSTINAAGVPDYYQPITQHGRRTDWGWNLDHLNITQASAVTAFFRAARANRVMIDEQYYKLLRLSWTGVGPWWDGALETVKA